MAHKLLMQAVSTGAIAGFRDYKVIMLHWHLELYQHCDAPAICEKEIGLLISLLSEAECVGVTAEGTSEPFVSAIRI